MDSTGTAYPVGHAGHIPGTISVPIPANIPAGLHATYLAATPTVRGSLCLGFPAPAVPIIAPTQDAINAGLLQALQDIRSDGATARKETLEAADKKVGKKVGATLSTSATAEQTRTALGTDASADPVPAHLHDRMAVRAQHPKLVYFSKKYLLAYGDPNSAQSKEIAANLSLPLRPASPDDFDPERLDIWMAAEHVFSRAKVAPRYYANTTEDKERRSDITMSLGFLKGIIIDLYSEAKFLPQKRAAFIYYDEILARTLGGQNGGSADVSVLDQGIYDYALMMANGFQQQQVAEQVGLSSKMERTTSAPNFGGADRSAGRDFRDSRDSRDRRDSRNSRDSYQDSYRDSRRDDRRFEPYGSPSPSKPFSSRGNDQDSNKPASSPRKPLTAVCLFCGSSQHGAKDCTSTKTRACTYDPTNNKFFIHYHAEPYRTLLARRYPPPPTLPFIPRTLASGQHLVYTENARLYPPFSHFRKDQRKDTYAWPANTAPMELAERKTAPSTSAAPSAEGMDAAPSNTSTPTTKVGTLVIKSDMEVAWEWARKITTPLISASWRELLGAIHPKAARPYAHVPDNIDNGWPLGIPPTVIIETTRAPKPTRPQTAEEDQGTRRHIVEEQDVDRFSPELRREAVEFGLGGPFQTSPMIPVPKEVTPDKNPWRIVRHFSSPEEGSYPSVNDLLREYPLFLPTYWTSIAEFGDIVFNASCDAKALVVDVKDAFRIIPLAPESRRWTVIQWGLGFIIDVGLVMGLVPSTDIWGSLIDLIRLYVGVVWAFVIMRNWVDDIVHVSEPPFGSTFAILEAALLAMYVWLGVPLSPHKTLSFSHSFPFCGYVWNLQTKYVYLKHSKRKKYHDALKTLLTGTPSVRQETMEQIAGFLSHLCFLVPGGKNHMTEIYRFQGTMDRRRPKQRHHPHGPPVEELRWWLAILEQEGEVGRFLMGKLPVCDVSIISDACPKGVGILVDGVWDYWPCLLGWDDEDNIDRAEGVGVLLGLIQFFGIFGDSMDGHLIKALCDNKSVVGGWAKGRNRNAAVNLIIRQIDELLCIHGCQLDLKYVKSKENEADPISRGDLLDFSSRSDRLDVHGQPLAWPAEMATCIDFFNRTPAVYPKSS
ncbi:hypothetical protein P7C70_g4111, partial [Phenoliferia sp. Uapishka_3]